MGIMRYYVFCIEHCVSEQGVEVTVGRRELSDNESKSGTLGLRKG